MVAPLVFVRDGLSLTTYSDTSPVRVVATAPPPAAPGAATYQWYVNNKPVGTTARLDTTITQPGISVVRVMVTASDGSGKQAWANVAVKPTPAQLRTWEADLLTLANAARTKAGLAPLTWTPALTISARAWSADMAANGMRVDTLRWASGFNYDTAAEDVAFHEASDVARDGAEWIHRTWAANPSANTTLLCPGCTLVGYGLDARIFRDDTGHPESVAVYSSARFIDLR